MIFSKNYTTSILTQIALGAQLLRLCARTLAASGPVVR
jgi:hypothetical protein